MDRVHSPLADGEFPFLCLALFFLCGVAAGQVLALGAPDSVGLELRRYLSEEYSSGAFSRNGYALLSVAAAYFRYPMLALFAGFTSAGIALLCGTAAAYGLFLSFAAGCFAAAWGREGLVLAGAALGIRCAVTLPCFFLMAVPAMEDSAARMRGQGILRDTKARKRRMALCGAVLVSGIWAELYLTPRLLQWAVERILS